MFSMMPLPIKRGLAADLQGICDPRVTRILWRVGATAEQLFLSCCSLARLQLFPGPRFKLVALGWP